MRAINPGNSGGALVDMTGRLAGINTAIYSRSGGSQGIGFAIPANMVRVVVASAKSGGKAVKRPWLGAQAAGGDAGDRRKPRPALADRRAGRQRRAGQPGGARRAEVVRPDHRRSTARRSTIPTRFDYRFATRPLGGTAQIDVQRAGKPVKLTMPLETAPDGGRDEITLKARSPFQGAKVANISPAVADELHLDSDTEGVVVTEIADDSHRRQCRLPEGRHHPGREQPEDRQDQRAREGDAASRSRVWRIS